MKVTADGWFVRLMMTFDDDLVSARAGNGVQCKPNLDLRDDGPHYFRQH